MATFPLNAPLTNDALIRTTCHLYRMSMLKVLPISIGLVLVYDFILYGAALFPAPYVALHSQVALFMAILFLPLMAMLFQLIDSIAKEQALSYGNSLIMTLKKLLTLIGCFFSMLLFPIFIMGICIGVYVFLGIKNFAQGVMFGWLLFSLVVVFAAFVPKLLAPILVVSDDQSANDSVDNSERLVKGHYLRTFMFMLYAILLLYFLVNLGNLAIAYVPSLKQHFMPIEIIAQCVLAIIGPWSFVLLLTMKYDLQKRVVTDKPVEIVRDKKKPDLKIVSKTEKGDKLNF